MRAAFLFAVVILAVGCSTSHHDDGLRADTGNPGLSADQSGQISVIIGGEVESPGQYAVPTGTHLLEAVERAGGFTEDALTRGVYVTRSDGTTYKFDLRNVTYGGNGDPVLRDGDSVGVPFWLRPQL